jgi:hypothetical protein
MLAASPDVNENSQSGAAIAEDLDWREDQRGKRKKAI